jgi:hypothetical protein
LVDVALDTNSSCDARRFRPKAPCQNGNTRAQSEGAAEVKFYMLIVVHMGLPQAGKL